MTKDNTSHTLRASSSQEKSRLLASRWINIEGMSLHTRVSTKHAPGGRPPVVLVHGYVISSRYMVPIARHLAPDFQVYAPDLPGFGRSSKPDHILNVTEMADVLAAWMEVMHLGSAVFVGNSFGCQVIVELALRYPEYVDRIVLQGPSIDPQARTAPRQIMRVLLDGLYEYPALPFLWLRDYFAAGPRRALETLRYLLQDPVEEKLPQINIPALVVRGAWDPIVPQRWAEEAARLLPEGRLVVIPRVGHAINYSAPGKLRKVIQPFLLNAAHCS